MKFEKDIAIEACKEAGTLLRNNFGKTRKFSFKRDKSIVSEMDSFCDQVIVNHLRKNYPEYGILSEEYGMIKGKTDKKWIIDPLDGTHAYLLGKEGFSVSVALLDGNDRKLGVVYNPMTDEVFSAERGKGAFCGNKKLQIKKGNQLIINYNFLKHPSTIPKVFKLRSKFKVTHGHGIAYDLCQVAKGTFSGFLSFKGHAWDFAAATLIVEEAGGVLKTKDGLSWKLHDENLVAGEENIVSEILGLI